MPLAVGKVNSFLPRRKVLTLTWWMPVCMIQPMPDNEKKQPTAFQRNICWLALSSFCLAFMVLLVSCVLYGIGYVFIALEPVLLPVIISGILAYLLNPSVKWVQRRVKKRLWAVLIVLMGTSVALGGLGMAIVPPLVRQSGELIAQRQQILESGVSTWHELLQENRVVQQAVDTLYSKTQKDASAAGLPETELEALSHAGTYEQKVLAVIDYNSGYLVEKGVDWLTAGTRAVYGASAFLIGAVMVPVFLFYFLLESEPIARNWDKVLPLRDSCFRDEVVGTLQEINQNIVAFVRGQMLVSLIDGVLLGIALKCMGLPYAITIAAAAALLGIIPYLGMISTSIPAMLIAWFCWHDFGHVAAVAIIFFSVSQLDGWIIQPRIVGKNMKMHDMTVMFSVLFWSIVFGGVIGALLAVPLTASIKVLFRRYVWGSWAEEKDRLPAAPEPGKAGTP